MGALGGSFRDVWKIDNGKCAEFWEFIDDHASFDAAWHK
jgi:hypothetical protein